MNTFLIFFAGIGITIYLISFFTKNIITAKRTKQSIKSKSWKVKSLTIIVSMLYIIAYLCVLFKHNFLINISFVQYFWLEIIGVFFMIFAIIIGLSTLVTMKDSWRMGVTEKQKTELILNGLFKYCRNPYYLSYHLLFSGFFLLFPTVGFLFFYVLFSILTHLLILDEEKYLSLEYGSKYSDYKKNVNRYIPFSIFKR